MVCKKCETESVITLPNSNVKLCKKCFSRYFERKVRKTIRIYNLIDKKDVIGVGVSGGKDSLSMLYLLNKIVGRQTKIIAIAIDEGIKGYRDLSNVVEFCKKYNIELHMYSYKDVFGFTLDEVLKKVKMKPCSVCGVLRRFILNTKARELGVNKLAIGHNLDDEAQTILMNQFRRNNDASVRLGPLTGIKDHKMFIRRIKPLYFLTEKECATFALANELITDYNECTYCGESYRCELRDMLNNWEAKYPGTKHSIVQSFIEVLPVLKKNYETKELKMCYQCGEPCSQNVCQVCKTLETIRGAGVKNAGRLQKKGKTNPGISKTIRV